jgi:hypothetical protein
VYVHVRKMVCLVRTKLGVELYKEQRKQGRPESTALAEDSETTHPVRFHLRQLRLDHMQYAQLRVRK